MNAGFSSLAKLKAQLLAEALRVDTAYDAPILAIGKGVAAQMQKFCNRLFQRVEGETYVFSADREFIYLPRSPVESITSIELRTDNTSGWVAQTDFIVNQDDTTGYVFWGADAGAYYARLRITYTGGYWWDETEEGNDTLPSGATAVPDDLVLAWHLQCRAVWQAVDKLGQDIVRTGNNTNQISSTLAGLGLSDEVKELLRGFVRYQLT